MRKIKLRGLAFAEGNSESATAARIFHFALDRFATAIREIELGLVDLNGPKGGVDKRCRARLSLMPRGTVVVDGVGETFLEALHGAAEKARRSLHRRLERRRERGRQDAVAARYDRAARTEISPTGVDPVRAASGRSVSGGVQ